MSAAGRVLDLAELARLTAVEALTAARLRTGRCTRLACPRAGTVTAGVTVTTPAGRVLEERRALYCPRHARQALRDLNRALGDG